MSFVPNTNPTQQRRPTLVHSAEPDGDETVSTFGKQQDRNIGDIFRETRNLTDEQIATITEHQRAKGLRFGESAVALGIATRADVIFALSQQFHYPYVPEARRNICRELVLANQPFSKQAEAVRSIRSQLLMHALNPKEQHRAMAVISPESGDGKTYFVANLGVALAQMGGRVLVVDADLRGPRLHEVFGIPNTTGLSSILSGRQEESVIHQSHDIPGLYVMPVGITPPNPLELLERPAFRLLLGELVRRFDHVLVDTPALQEGCDTTVIANKCGLALALARKNKTRINRLDQLLAAVNSSATRLAGVVVNEF
ncbi:MAG: polysaccharide biosynthesis tyrosine autokinase [Leptothrix sp. (in: b-proteobacteria)]